MTDHRYEARADIVAGECELAVKGGLMQLVTLTLTDAGPITLPDGTDEHRPDVICPLRASEARALAGRLLELADHAAAPTAPR
ncbi:MAG: hypothetical protein MSC31_19560 [Solirubrobacteraceae bacterium MAG38_C4-C5]|nr:hypothetical protein [Candidatus Siliceabacter maunaloa]